MPKILIVDDEPAILNLLRMAFVRAGYDVSVARDPGEVPALCAAETFDVVLSDVVMPAMNGHDLAQWIAARHPATRTVLMSGYDLGCQRCPYSPRCKLLSKPFHPAEAISLVERVLAAPAA